MDLSFQFLARSSIPLNVHGGPSLPLKRLGHGHTSRPQIQMKSYPYQNLKVTTRRTFLKSTMALALLLPAANISKAATDTAQENALNDLRMVTELQAQAFDFTNKMKYDKAEELWNKLISLNTNNAAAWSNRGNCRTSQGKFNEAIEDFNQAIKLAPDEPDPYLGRGVAYEGLARFELSLKDYESANQKAISRYGSEDPVAYNNTGNAYAGLGMWELAYQNYHKAAEMNRQYVFARENEALALYQLGDVDKCLQTLKFLIRKYPTFADAYAGLVAVSWAKGDLAGAESQWSKVMELDSRYKSIEWVRKFRRWPPSLADSLEKFLTLS